MPYSEERINRFRLIDKAVKDLLGICAGITADGVLSDSEIQYLKTWLLQHQNVMNEHPIDKLARRMETVLRENTISEEARADLLEFLKALSGNYFSETGAVEPEAAFVGIPFDDDQPIVFVAGENKKPRCFCLTGKFAFGSRSICEQAVIDLGGSIVPKEMSLAVDYLVVGSAGVTASWKNTTYGRKIQKAIDYREASKQSREMGERVRLKPLIVSEEAWLKAIQNRTERPKRIDDPAAFFAGWLYNITPHHYGIFGLQNETGTSCWLVPEPLTLDIQEGYVFYKRGTNDSEFLQINKVDGEVVHLQFGLVGKPVQGTDITTKRLLRLHLEMGQ